MGPSALMVFLAVVLTASLPARPSMVHAEGSRLNEGDTQLNRLDTRLSTQLNGLTTRLNTRQKEVNSRFNRIENRLDGIETAISDMQDFLQERIDAVDKKMEWALTGTKPSQEGQPRTYRGCQDALARGATTSGVYTISPDPDISFNVYCEQRVDGGGWTVFQNRYNGSVEFYKNWATYKAGFGNVSGEFWLGNEKIHQLTKYYDQQLKIELMSPEGEVMFADYSSFWVADESFKFRLTVTGFSGGSPPGDAMANHNGARFSTYDHDYDKYTEIDCATTFRGGWWYNNCHHANLNGLYGSTVQGKGLNWKEWKGWEVSMRATRMMIRTKS